MEIVIAIVIVVAIMGIGTYLQTKWDDQREKALQDVATEQQLVFLPEDHQESQYGKLTKLPFFKEGHGQEVSNIMLGDDQGISIMLFDYEYTIGAGKGRTTYKQTAAFYKSDNLQAPAFELSPEGFWERVKHQFGHQDIDFDDHPKFSKSYQLKGEDEASIRHYFTQQQLQYFSEHSGLHIEANGPGIVIMRHNERVAPEAWPAFLQETLGIFKLFVDK